jgi:hypothetical protein
VVKVLAAVALAAAACAPGALAQIQPGEAGGRVVAMATDSLERRVDGAIGGPAKLVWSEDVIVDRAGWLRLRFAKVLLSGDPTSGNGAYVVVRSMQDDAQQRLDAETIAQWGQTSAYFNGPIVRVELWAYPGAGPSRVAVDSVWAGQTPASPEDLCGVDDRVPASDNRTARLLNGTVVCTTWMHNDTNRFFISAGHCAPTGTSVVQFNVPASDSTGAIQHPPPQDQYSVDAASVQRQTVGTNNDWSYFGVFTNSNTGLTPIQRYGAFHTLASEAPMVTNQLVTVTGFGSVAAPVSPTLNFTQTTQTGAYTFMINNLVRYEVDTTGGNSGSAVVDNSTGRVIGIHYFAGCLTGGNQAVNVANANFRAALASPLGVCRTGKGNVRGDLFAIGDLANNFGTASTMPDNFAGIGKAGRWWRGMTFDAMTGTFLAIDSTRTLHRLMRTGEATPLGVVSGPTNTLTGLALQPETGRLLAMEPAVGRLWSVDVSTLVATPIGAPQGGNMVGLDYDPMTGTLYALERASTGASLWRVNPGTGERTLIGPLAGLTTQVGDIAFNPLDRSLYAMNTSTASIVRIDPANAAIITSGSDVGPTNGVFGSSYGLAFGLSARTCPADYNNDSFLNLDDLGDFVTDYYIFPPIPGGLQASALTYPDRMVGYGTPCPNAPDAPAPFDPGAYRTNGYRVGFSPAGDNTCPPTGPNLDNLGDFITAYYAGC